MAPLDFEKSMTPKMVKSFTEKETEIVVYPFVPQTLATVESINKRMITGLFFTDNQTYMLTVLTDQSNKLISKLISDEFIVRGIFSKQLWPTENGETYRPIFGKIEKLPIINKTKGTNK